MKIHLDRSHQRRAVKAPTALVSVVAAAVAVSTGQAGATVAVDPPARATATVDGACAPALIDDFSSGAYRSPDLQVDTADATKDGTMLGGRRFTRFHSGPNRYALPATLVIPAANKAPLVVSSGYQGFAQLQVHYGILKAGTVAPLNADLSCYDRFRVTFPASDAPLNVNVQVKSASSPTVYQCGSNLAAHPTDAFVAEFKFSCFVTNDPAHPPVDWTDIDRVSLLVQNAGQLGAADYAISRIDLAG